MEKAIFPEVLLILPGSLSHHAEQLIKTSAIQYPPPRFTGIPLPTSAPTPPTVSASPSTPQAYAISPEEQHKYSELFKSYDTSRTGSAVILCLRSHLIQILIPILYYANLRQEWSRSTGLTAYRIKYNLPR